MLITGSGPDLSKTPAEALSPFPRRPPGLSAKVAILDASLGGNAKALAKPGCLKK
jgi:hypothetical protein